MKTSYSVPQHGGTKLKDDAEFVKLLDELPFTAALYSYLCVSSDFINFGL